MPALYKFPPHPLCPHIQFKQVGRCCEDELPPWPEPSPPDQPGSVKYKVTQLDRIAREDSGASNHGVHEEGSAHVAEGGHIVGSCDKPTKESRRERRAATTSQRELDALELEIPYAMTTVPDCTITSAGIHVSLLLHLLRPLGTCWNGRPWCLQRECSNGVDETPPSTANLACRENLHADGVDEQGSILCPAFKREIWEDATGELLHLCHEAAERRSQKTGDRPVATA